MTIYVAFGKLGMQEFGGRAEMKVGGLMGTRSSFRRSVPDSRPNFCFGPGAARTTLPPRR